MSGPNLQLTRLLTRTFIYYAAIQVMQEWGDVGNVRPVHLREAHRQIEAAGELPNAPKTLRFGRPRS